MCGPETYLPLTHETTTSLKAKPASVADLAGLHLEMVLPGPLHRMSAPCLRLLITLSRMSLLLMLSLLAIYSKKSALTLDCGVDGMSVLGQKFHHSAGGSDM